MRDKHYMARVIDPPEKYNCYNNIFYDVDFHDAYPYIAKIELQMGQRSVEMYVFLQDEDDISHDPYERFFIAADKLKSFNDGGQPVFYYEARKGASPDLQGGVHTQRFNAFSARRHRPLFTLPANVVFFEEAVENGIYSGVLDWKDDTFFTSEMFRWADDEERGLLGQFEKSAVIVMELDSPPAYGSSLHFRKFEVWGVVPDASDGRAAFYCRETPKPDDFFF